jgi:YD repeat-containing protein
MGGNTKGDTTFVSFAYDGHGRRTSVTDRKARSLLTYDDADCLPGL